MTALPIRSIVLLFLPFATLHCANDPTSVVEASDATYACLMTSGQVRTCVHDDNLTPEQAITAANRCTSSAETTAVKVDACPESDRVGSCISVAGPLTQTFIFYGDGGLSTEAAEKNCQVVSGLFVR